MEALTNEQLCALAQAGDTEAVETIIEKNRSYVQQLAKRLIYNPIRSELFTAWGIEQDDLVQVGLMGLGNHSFAKANNIRKKKTIVLH